MSIADECKKVVYHYVCAFNRGDMVALNFQAPVFGVEPTGKSYELVAMEWSEIEDGKIRRRWGARNAASQAISMCPRRMHCRADDL